MSSNAISLSQQDEPLGFGTLAVGGAGGRARGVAGYYSSATQYLVPETHDYSSDNRRLSAHFPPDLGLTQPVSTYGEAGSSRLEPDPYIRNTYSHRRRHKSHSGSRTRITEELRSGNSSQHRGGGESSNAILSNSHDRLKIEDAPRLPGQNFYGASRSITNLSTSSRPPRYSSRNYRGSQEHLRPSEFKGNSTLHHGGFDGIGAALPAYAVGQALTQPVFPEKEDMEIGRSQGGVGATRPSTKSSRKVVEATSKDRERKLEGRNVRHTASLSPPQIVVEGEESNPVKANGEVGGAMSAAMVTGPTHHLNGVPSSGSDSENQITKVTSNQEEAAPIVWEVINPWPMSQITYSIFFFTKLQNLGSLGQNRQRVNES